MLVLFLLAPGALGIHFYRGPGSGCTANDGARSDDPDTSTPPDGVPDSGPSGGTVELLHNSFNNQATGLPVLRVAAGESITWRWLSSHCHSVQSNPNPNEAWNSGFHYPAAAPESMPVLPGLFHYPVPDTTPTLTFTHTFDAPGTYTYFCIHHSAIGMRGVVVVE